MLQVGITGNIGSGKSAVSAYLVGKGYSVIDADALVKEIYKDPDFISQMLLAFGEGIKSKNFDLDQELDKKKIGQLVFSDKENLEKLEKLIAPFFKKNWNQALERHKEERILFLDIPLLYEKGYDQWMDKVLLVYTEDQIRYQRASQRDQKTIEEILRIDKNQMPQEDKRLLADYVIDNNLDYPHLYRQIEEVLDQIIR